MSGPRPPALGRWILRRLLPDRWRDGILRDLEEVYQERHARSALGARTWYAGQVVAFAVRFGPDAARGGGPGPLRSLRVTARALARTPGWTFLVVGTLGLGIGATAAVASVVRHALLAPLPADRPDEVVVAWHDHRVRSYEHFPFSREAWAEVRARASALDRVGGVDAWGAVDRIVGEGDAEETVRWSRTTGDFFGALGTDPILGRVLGPEDDAPGAPGRVVLSEGFWTRRYGRDPDVLGRPLPMNGEAWTIVGVAPDLDLPRGTEIWSATGPFHPEGLDDAGLELDLVGRLVPGAEPADLAEQIEAAYRASPSLRSDYDGAVPVVRTLPDVVLGDIRATLLLLLGGSLLVLGVAGLNASNLVLVRAERRRGLTAVRRAMGASRATLVRHVLEEAALLAAGAWIVGGALAFAGLRLVLPRVPAGLPRLDGIAAADLPVLLGAGVLAGLVLVTAALPSLAFSLRADPAATLRGTGGASGGGLPLRRVAVAGQIALALWLVAGGALAADELRRLLALEPGFDTADLFLVETETPWPNFELPPGLADRMAGAAERLSRRPEVERATWALSPPLIGSGGFAVVPILDGQSREEAMEENPFFRLQLGFEDRLELLGVPLVRGRGIRAEDRAGSERVALVNETAARTLWPDRDAIGARFRLPFPGLEDEPWTVVGITADTRYASLTASRPVAQLSPRQLDLFAPSWLLVRAPPGLPGGALASAARAELRAAFPDVRVKGVSSVRSRMREPLARPLFGTLILSVFGAAVLALAAVGVHGAVSSHVVARRRELGVRMACGAAPSRVRLDVLRDVGTAALPGIALGGVATLLTADLLRASLPGGGTGSVTGPLLGVAVVVASAALAAWLPAVAAARRSPSDALRVE